METLQRMALAVVVLIRIQNIHSENSGPWLSVNMHEYMVGFNETGISADQACGPQHFKTSAHLAKVTTMEEFVLLNYSLIGKYDMVLIGLIKDIGRDRMLWRDGTPYNSSLGSFWAQPPAQTDLSNINFQFCVAVTTRNLKWITLPCREKKTFLCQRLIGVCPNGITVCENGGTCNISSCICSPGFTGVHCESVISGPWQSINMHEYMVGFNETDYNADVVCEKNSAHLAKVTTMEEFVLLNSSLIGKYDMVRIGLTKGFNHIAMQWRDGTPYTNSLDSFWAQPPTQADVSNYQKKFCVAVTTRKLKWITVEPCQQKMTFLCQRRGPNNVTVGSTPPHVIPKTTQSLGNERGPPTVERSKTTPSLVNETACIRASRCSNNSQCECAPGCTGKRCEINFDECASHPCSNDAPCLDMMNGYTCNCRSSFTGVHCESANDCTGDICKQNIEQSTSLFDGQFNCGQRWTIHRAIISVLIINYYN